MSDKIAIVGSDGQTHLIDPATYDRFHDGKTGQPITDEQWNETKARAAGEFDGR